MRVCARHQPAALCPMNLCFACGRELMLVPTSSTVYRQSLTNEDNTRLNHPPPVNKLEETGIGGIKELHASSRKCPYGTYSAEQMGMTDGIAATFSAATTAGVVVLLVMRTHTVFWPKYRFFRGRCSGGVTDWARDPVLRAPSYQPFFLAPRHTQSSASFVCVY